MADAALGLHQSCHLLGSGLASSRLGKGGGPPLPRDGRLGNPVLLHYPLTLFYQPRIELLALILRLVIELVGRRAQHVVVLPDQDRSRYLLLCLRRLRRRPTPLLIFIVCFILLVPLPALVLPLHNNVDVEPHDLAGVVLVNAGDLAGNPLLLVRVLIQHFNLKDRPDLERMLLRLRDAIHGRVLRFLIHRYPFARRRGLLWSARSVELDGVVPDQVDALHKVAAAADDFLVDLHEDCCHVHRVLDYLLVRFPNQRVLDLLQHRIVEVLELSVLQQLEADLAQVHAHPTHRLVLPLLLLWVHVLRSGPRLLHLVLLQLRGRGGDLGVFFPNFDILAERSKEHLSLRLRRRRDLVRMKHREDASAAQQARELEVLADVHRREKQDRSSGRERAQSGFEARLEGL
mmetsp:Transcript_51982/g.105892  ORF Transcript_51982/g.105892 Transcript_51982/m.105892 type:complete len:403 (-) Transcript_51982:1457-2665(-)